MYNILVHGHTTIIRWWGGEKITRNSCYSNTVYWFIDLQINSL